MKKLVVVLTLIGFFVLSFGAFRDVPTNHWALKSIEKLVSIGVITGFPDNTFRGDESLTRYQSAQLIDRTLDYIENNLIAGLKEIINVLKGTLEKHSEQLDGFSNTLTDLSIALEVHEKDILVLYETTENLRKTIEENNVKFEEVVKELNEVLDVFANRLELLEEHANMIYEILKTKVDNEVYEEAMVEKEERISALETVVLNMKSTLEDGLPALRAAVYQLYEDLASLENKLTEYVNVITEELTGRIDLVDDSIEVLETKILLLEDYANSMYEMLQAKVDNEVFEETVNRLAEEVLRLDTEVEDLEDVMNIFVNRIELLEEHANTIYDMLQTKVDSEVFEEKTAELENELSSLNDQIAYLETKLTEYVNVKSEELKGLFETLETRVALLEEYGNVLYETLQTKVDNDVFEEKVAQIEESLDSVAERVSLLEDYSNMLYDSQELLLEKINEISEKVDNTQENMVNLIHEKTTTLQQNIELVSLDILNIISKNQEQDDKLSELAEKINTIDLRVVNLEEMTKKLNDSLSVTNEKVAQLENQLAQKNQEIESLKQVNQIATILGATGVIIGIIAILKAFGVF